MPMLPKGKVIEEQKEGNLRSTDMSQPDNLDFGPPPVFSSILEYNCQVILAMKTLMCLQDLVESSKCCSRFVPLYHREDRCNLKLSGRILQLFKFREEVIAIYPRQKRYSPVN
ncbi:Uncharacterized protein Fot_09005 [Forsythia ovata]|uniref:Uncharacterized protein n=1 Tax=Forsythia ovata TaxID=205694 RepID=A0ABD1WGG8_9LAMI